MPLIALLRSSVHPQAIQRYERAAQRLAARARDDADTFRWSARQVNGLEGRQYGYIAPAASFAELAGREEIDAMVRRVFGESAGNALLDELAEAVTQQNFSVLSPREDLSNVTLPLESPPPLMHHTQLRVRPGGQEAIEELIRKVLEASAKLDDKRKILTTLTVIGDVGEYGVVRAIWDPAELDSQLPPPALLVEAFGEKEGRKILEAASGHLESIVTLLSVYRPDLSNEG